MNADRLRDLAIDWLCERHPDSVVVRELSIADWGGASLDVASITRTHIVGVEIKGEGDSPSRLERQGLAYGMVAREMWLLADESIRGRCHAQKPPGWGRLEVWQGRVRPLNRAQRGDGWEKTRYGRRLRMVRDDSRYDPDTAREQPCQSPWAMCGTLWRDELYEIARRNSVDLGGRKALVGALTEAVCAQLPAPHIHAEMIAQLRQRSWRGKRGVIDARPSREPGLFEEERS